MLNLKGLATGIGSLPYLDANSALDIIFKYCPDIPFWPQLPKRAAREGMVAQFSEHFPCLEIQDNQLNFNPKNKDKELEIFYDRIISEDLDYFKISPDFASGLYGFYQRLEGLEASALNKIQFIKCHVTGPFTFAASIKDETGAALLHNDIFMQAILKAIAMKALWQVNLFKKFGKKIIIFFDEPYLGCFGSAYTSVNREDVIKGLSELTQAVKIGDVFTGVHCCGNTDWSIFTDTADLDIINFDAFAFFERLALYVQDLKKFLKKGGAFCWGIVPTNESDVSLVPDALLEKIKQSINTLVNKGLSKESVTDNLLISPACGLGTLSVEKSEKIFKALSETASLIGEFL